MNLLKLIKNNFESVFTVLFIIFILSYLKENYNIEHLTSKQEPLVSVTYNTTLNPDHMDYNKNANKKIEKNNKPENCDYKTPFENDIYKHSIRFKPTEYKKTESNHKSERSDNVLDAIDIKESNNNLVTGYEKQQKHKEYEKENTVHNKLDININLELGDRDIRKPSKKFNEKKEIHKKQKNLEFRTDTEHQDNYEIIQNKLNPDDLLPSNSTGQVYNTDMNYQSTGYIYTDPNYWAEINNRDIANTNANPKAIEKEDYAMYNSEECETEKQNYFYYDNN